MMGVAVPSHGHRANVLLEDSHMHDSWRTKARLACSGAFFLALAFGVSASHASGPAAATASISGSYDATIDFFGVPLRALYSFNPGGVLTESDNPAIDPNFGNLAFSPGHGSWKRSAGGDIEAVYRKLAYDSNGVLQQVAISTLELERSDSGSLEGTLSLQLTDPAGNVLVTIPDLGFEAEPITVD